MKLLSRKKKYDPEPEIAKLRRFMYENNKIDADFEVEAEFMATFFAHLALFVGEAPNYVEQQLELEICPKDKPFREHFIITVQRRSGKSPHELRTEAEIRLEDLRYRHTKVMNYNIQLRDAVARYLDNPSEENQQLLAEALKSEE